MPIFSPFHERVAPYCTSFAWKDWAGYYTASHYGETLRRWRQRFLANREVIRELGYSESFLRMWEFYLAYCEGGFDAGRSASVQLLLSKPRSLRPSVLGALD